jgi:hypothetical protein
MKICNRCREHKEEEDFPPSQWEKKSSRCRACQKELSADHYQKYKKNYDRRDAQKRAKYKKFIDSRKNKPCMDCGETYPPYVMDFDHRDPAKKSFCIAKARHKGVTFKMLEEEIAKCDLVCANCHRKRTHTPK